MAELLPVILAGGSGTRLWPMSREMYPKQFLKLYGDSSMLQHTLKRLEGLGGQPPLIVCNEEHRFLVAEQCRSANQPIGAVILESHPRNTAPAIAVAAFHAINSGTDPILMVLPADHYVADVKAFEAAVTTAVAAVDEGGLLTFGITPSRVETGFGYIKAGNALGGGSGAYTVDCFVEKPDTETARKYLQSGEYYWNSGMFVFRASSFLNELKAHRPDIYEACELAVEHETLDMDFCRPGSEFSLCPAESIDYAVMEVTKAAIMLPLECGWNDLGSWDSLWEISEQDGDGNIASGDVITRDTHNSFIHADERLVTTIGLDDMVIVETADAVLVAKKDTVQDVKKVVGQIRQSARSEHQHHVRVFRPWGSYESVESGDRYQVKRITVNPGATLSLQMHHHRSEHWIVVKGTATVTRGDEEFVMSENESTYITLGQTHRLANPGKLPLELIEVQVGAYLGEDDIVRFEDVYNRN